MLKQPDTFDLVGWMKEHSLQTREPEPYNGNRERRTARIARSLAVHGGHRWPH